MRSGSRFGVFRNSSGSISLETVPSLPAFGSEPTVVVCHLLSTLDGQRDVSGYVCFLTAYHRQQRRDLWLIVLAPRLAERPDCMVCYASLVDAYLAAPLRPQELLAVLRHLAEELNYMSGQCPDTTLSWAQEESRSIEMARGEKSATLELRVTPAQKELLRQAAGVRGQSMSEFVLATVTPVAEELVEGHHQIRLSQRAWEEFVRMTTDVVPATPLARQEAGEFLRRLEGGEAAAR